MKKTDKVIFAVDNGISRAPMAAALFSQMVPQDCIRCVARGVNVAFEEPLNQKAEAVMIAAKLPTEGYQARSLSDMEITDTTLIFTMEEQQRIDIIEKFPHATEENTFVLSSYVGDELEIVDPYGGSVQTYGICLEVIRASVSKLAELLMEGESSDE